MRRDWNDVHCWGDGKLVQPLWKITWCFLRKVYHRITYDPAIPLSIFPDIHLKIESWYSNKYTNLQVYSSTSYNSQKTEMT